MKALFIGGTGTISMAISKRLIALGHELYLLNRGNRTAELPEGAISLVADINDEAKVRELTAGMMFDVIADFIAFTPDQVERDYRLFRGMMRQYIYISSASAYQKPLSNPIITEGSTLSNPFWQYSRNKIACEELLMKWYREENFPVTIVRPSHTYDERRVPLGVEGKNGSWQVLDRMLHGKPVILHGDGTTLWTVTHNSDFAKGFVGLMGNVRAIGEAVQITSDESLTWNQIYQATADALGVELKPYYVSTKFLEAVGEPGSMDGLWGDKSHTVIFDNSKLKRLVPGYQATMNFSEGVRLAVKTILANPAYQKADPEFDAWCDRVIAAQEAAKKAVLG